MDDTTPAYPCLIEEKLLRVERRLPADGSISVEIGQRVAADEVVGTVRGHGATVSLAAAAELGLEPADVVRGLVKEFGADVRAGDVLVSVRSGLRRKELRAKEDGRLISADAITGQLVFQPNDGKHELKAYVSGIVDEIDPRRAVTISTVATRVQGAWGLGGESVGVLHVLTKGHDEDLRPDLIDQRASLAVIVAGRGASSDALKKAASVGVRAVVLGSIEATELQAFMQAQARSAPRWHVAGPEWQLPSPAPILPFSLIVIEGFGRLSMAREIFDALHACESREVSLRGTTRLRGELQRPELIVPLTGRADGQAERAGAAVLRPGARVRLTAPSHLGQYAVVLGVSSRMPAGDGLLRDMVEIELDGGGRRLLPASNLEVLR